MVESSQFFSSQQNIPSDSRIFLLLEGYNIFYGSEHSKYSFFIIIIFFLIEMQYSSTEQPTFYNIQL